MILFLCRILVQVLSAPPRHGNQDFHLAAASIWGMMALRLANEEILPFNYMSYAIELEVRCLQCLLNAASDLL